MRIFICLSAGIVMTLLTGAAWAETARFDAVQDKQRADASNRSSADRTLDCRAGRLDVTRKDGTYRVELRGDQGGQLAQPAEGLWSIATGWKDDWPTDWRHGQAEKYRRSGPWLVLSGTVATNQGDWLMRDARTLPKACGYAVSVAGSGRANSRPGT